MRKTPKGVEAMQSAAAAAIAALTAAPAVAAAALAVLAPDPVLFGAITLTGSALPGTPAAFFLIAQWS